MNREDFPILKNDIAPITRSVIAIKKFLIVLV